MYSVWGKRLLDIFFSIFLLILLSPLFFLISLLIYIFDSRPIFFKQERVGRQGSKFLIFKFRSMPVGASQIKTSEAYELRTTFIGKYIRRLYIDELPQLFNIIKGEMSIVGPRPILTNMDYMNNLREEKKISFLRPGITGLAQLDSYDNMSEDAKINLEIKYMNNISLLYDFFLILRTFLYIFKKPTND
ncbi:sugar transferase [Pelagibacterales bacterium]|nr:sugar transferase [Pelagibacterales bacterium]